MKIQGIKGVLVLALGAATVLPAMVPAQARDQYRDRQRYRQNQNRQVYYGVVTKRHSRTQFDIRINGNTYNVYTDNNVPSRLDKNDRVRVEGWRYGQNDIRDARVTIIRDR